MNKINYEKLNDSFNNNELIVRLNEALRTYLVKNDISLIGGSVIDILEGRTPKDYDIIINSSVSLKHVQTELIDKIGMVFIRDTKTAVTLLFENRHLIQLLKKSINDFDFTISQTRYCFKNKTIRDLDEVSYLKKTLIPVSYESSNAYNSLLRIPHWKKKGYEIDDLTYLSLLNSAIKINNNSNS